MGGAFNCYWTVGDLFVINLRSQVFSPKNRKNKTPKRKKNKLCVLKTFRECLQKEKKKIGNKQSDIKLTWSNHIKKWFLLWPWALIIQSFYSKYRQLSETATMFRYRYFKQQKFAIRPLWIGFTCGFLGHSYSIVQGVKWQRRLRK